ncbi:jasmonate-induced oxygenase 4-like [Lolium rigidum]|uniref:jasmonate-induced oxygenase 4-like n=1 Tax=Lolium rigidum TaxID=89674 RepID=UPI001F5E1DE7|nr:jasmonate-induced oxygenase 4-like [Lolium rigidum]
MADDEQQWKIPPNVQELAAAGRDELPSRYVVPDHDRPTSGVASDDPIPVVDISRLSSGAADEAAKLRSALQNWGLFLAIGHGIESALLDEMMAVTREFFKLPLQEKQKYTNLVGSKKEYQLEGYGGDMVLSETQVLDWCDRFYLVVEPESRRIYDLWPTQPPSFRDILHRYAKRCRELADGVLLEVGKVVGLREERYMADMVDEKAVTYVRLNLYPRCPRPDKVLGFKAHSDGNMLTVLLTNAVGLQVLRDGEWYDVPVVPGALVVNIGDTVEVVSNGLLKSPVHKVVANSERERVSVGAFYTLDPEREVEPAPELVTEDRPKRYGKMKTSDYITELQKSLARGERTVDRVKI